MVSAVEKVRERLLRAAGALDRAGVPYAIIGGNAVFLWMVRHGEGGERFTPNVDLLVNRADLASIEAVLGGVGFLPDFDQPDSFRDGSEGSPRKRLQLLIDTPEG